MDCLSANFLNDLAHRPYKTVHDVKQTSSGMRRKFISRPSTALDLKFFLHSVNLENRANEKMHRSC